MAGLALVGSTMAPTSAAFADAGAASVQASQTASEPAATSTASPEGSTSDGSGGAADGSPTPSDASETTSAPSTTSSPTPSGSPDEASSEPSEADSTEPTSDETSESTEESTEESAPAEGETDDGAGDQERPSEDSASPETDDEAAGVDEEANDEAGAPSPLTVPEPEDAEAVITVSVGGDRSGESSVAPLEGVTLQLHDGGGAGPGDPVEASWATCVSDGDGDCSFTVPDAQRECTWDTIFGCFDWDEGENWDRSFWVVADDAPQGWSLNDTLVTSSGENPYTFRTPGVEGGETYRSGEDFMTEGDSGYRGSSGVWQLTRDNPELKTTCQAGIDVALTLDLSGSVEEAGAVDDLRQAAKDMVESLHGTGSSVALYTFARDAPRNQGSSGRNYESMAIDSGDNLDTITDRIDDYEAGGGTNWDEGIGQVAADDADYDLSVVITDGLPTFYNAGGAGNVTEFTEVEQAVFSANALKADGTRMLPVGVGEGTSGSAANLSAASGPTAYQPGAPALDADYFQSDWESLSGLLEEVARGATCQATIDVAKNTVAHGEEDPSSGGSGWRFDVDATDGSLSPESTQSTDDSGTAAWTLGFGTADPEAPASVSIEEVLTDEQRDAGWALENASCTVNGSSVDSASEITVTSGDAVECTFLNVQSLVPDVEIDKRAWDTPSPDGLQEAEEIADGDDVTTGTTITWTYEVTNTGETPLHDVEVADDQVGSATCPTTTLEPGGTTTCTASGPVSALP